MISELSKSPRISFTLGNCLLKLGGGRRSKTVMSYSGCLWTRVAKTDPPIYPVAPVLEAESVAIFLEGNILNFTGRSLVAS